MAKIKWHEHLAPYKGSRYNMGEVVRFAQGLEGEGVERVLELVGQRFPLEKQGGLLEKPQKFLAIQPALAPFDSATFDQMKLASRLPVFVGGALMPDAHKGYALPIGGVAVLENAVSPSFVGYDIACRMTLSELGISPQDEVGAIRAIKRVARFGYQENDGENEQWHKVLENPLWDSLPVLRSLKNQARLQLGTSGSGNHFIDLMKWDGGYALLTHSGSRGVGHKAAAHYMNLAKKVCPAKVPDGYEYMPFSSEEGQEYWAVMQLMGEYAQACHHIIHARVHFALWMEGISSAFSNGLLREAETLFEKVAVQVDGAKSVQKLTLLENHHNFTWQEGNLFIHRKGATPAAIGQWGIIPGSSGSNSYVVRGVAGGLQAEKGKAHLSETWNSASHGAGRPYSRTQAKALHDAGKVSAHYEGAGIQTFGVAPDETMFAYKDIEDVMAAQALQVEKRRTLQPVFVAMGGLQASDDGD